MNNDAGASKIKCGTCGEFVVTDEALEDYLKNNLPWWNDVRRAALSHLVRSGRDLPRHDGTSLPILNREILARFEKQGLPLPPPTDQIRNLIRFVAERERADGRNAEIDQTSLHAIVGAPSLNAITELAYDLQDEGLISLVPDVRPPANTGFANARLTLAGWRQWEALQSGSAATKDGFIAMQFGDPRLDAFVADVIQAGVQRELGVSVHRVDSPGVARAGIIDNIMREAITDAAFVLVDLSHGNRGAYWEAGYAEGLGKPVIYICEQAVWNNQDTRPHFDVNHCTTLMWSAGKEEEFIRQLAATIKTSLAKSANRSGGS